MEVSNLGLIISTLLVIAGWFINSYFNRKHEKLKKQIEYRLMTLQSFTLIKNSFTSSSKPFEDDVNLKSNIEKTRVFSLPCSCVGVCISSCCHGKTSKLYSLYPLFS